MKHNTPKVKSNVRHWANSKMEDAFKDLTVLEEMLEQLDAGKTLQVKKNDIVYRAMFRAMNTLRNRIYAGFQTARANLEMARPESKLKGTAMYNRTKRREQNELFYQQLEDYFKDKNGE